MLANKRDKIELRWLREDDWELYRELRLEAIQTIPTAFGSDYAEAENLDESVWKERIVNTLFAFEDGRPVGMIGHVRQARMKQRHIFHIVGFYVKEGSRGRGIGDMLFKEILSRIENYQDVTKVSLAVTSIHADALHLYRKNGFEVVGILKKELRVEDRFYDQVLLDKIL